MPETISKLRSYNFGSKPKSTRLPSDLRTDFQSNFKNVYTDIPFFSILVPKPETMPSPVPKQPKRQKSSYYITEKPLVTESQRQTLGDQSFDAWDKENKLKYRAEVSSPGSSNFRISELRNSNFRSNTKDNPKASKSSSKTNFPSIFDDLSFDKETQSFSSISQRPMIISKPETKQPKRQKSTYDKANKAQTDEPEQRSWDEKS